MASYIMFDIEKVAKESGLPSTEIEKIKQEVRKEFPHDEMMWELHVIRATKNRQKEIQQQPKIQTAG